MTTETSIDTDIDICAFYKLSPEKKAEFITRYTLDGSEVPPMSNREDIRIYLHKNIPDHPGLGPDGWLVDERDWCLSEAIEEGVYCIRWTFDNDWRTAGA